MARSWAYAATRNIDGLAYEVAITSLLERHRYPDCDCTGRLGSEKVSKSIRRQDRIDGVDSGLIDIDEHVHFPA
jgi:hypothetical protein